MDCRDDAYLFEFGFIKKVEIKNCTFLFSKFIMTIKNSEKGRYKLLEFAMEIKHLNTNEAPKCINVTIIKT